MSELSMDRQQVRLEALKLAVEHVNECDKNITHREQLRGYRQIIFISSQFEEYIETGKRP